MSPNIWRHVTSSNKNRNEVKMDEKLRLGINIIQKKVRLLNVTLDRFSERVAAVKRNVCY